MGLANVHRSFMYRCRHLLRGLWIVAVLGGIFYMVVPATMITWDDSISQKLYDIAVQPQGFYDVFGFREDSAFLLVTVIATVGCLALITLSWQALGKQPQAKRFISAAAAMTALMAAGLVYSATHTNRYGSVARASSIGSQLMTIRSQLELYQVQHNGDYPKLEKMWDALTKATDVDGNIILPSSPVYDDAGQRIETFGPYLQQPQVNTFSNDAVVSADNSGSWAYDQLTGSIRAVMPREVIELYQMSDTDCVASTYAWVPGSRDRFTNWRAFLIQLDDIWYSLRKGFYLPVFAALLVYFVCRHRLGRLFMQRNLYNNAFRYMTVLSAITILGLFAAGFWFDNATSQTIRFTFGFTLLWGVGCRLHLLHHADYQHLWTQQCIHCGYDLTGTFQAGRCECPECGKFVLRVDSTSQTTTSRAA